MSASPRQEALKAITNRTPVPAPDLGTTSFTELFGVKVFNDAVQRRRLPRTVYQKLRRTVDAGEALDPKIADAVADAMKDWAVEHGASHYSHWFQPMTGLTAEKHDSFLSPLVEGGALHAFSGTQLTQGEPDASSFPSGGIRATFEARGYTAWDPTSPAFLRETDFGATLFIPTAFCSWTGEALDMKTPLLRSTEALDRAARRMLKLLGEAPGRVVATVGPEQEYFLVDRNLYHLRPDLVSCGRTLFGARPPKGQELEDHYFGAISQRVLAFMMDLEQELWRLGIPIKTRHNEVAPSQFELAPIFEQVTVATDHNMLTMEVLKEVAERHGLYCMLAEKPFAGVNGSGKHNNWSMADNLGNNLLEPGSTPHDNLKFVVFLTAIIRAVDLYQDLLRATVATAGNDHRLGANEAPPAIVSIFAGSQLEEVIFSLIEGRAPRTSADRKELRLGVHTLPPLPRDQSDRNRTSPFAFTGNKFEFRAVGSSQSIAYPNTILNTIVAESLDFMSSEIEKRGGTGDRREAIQALVRETLTKHKRILFSGDNYSAEWVQEAEKRGLSNAKDTPTALAAFTAKKNVDVFEKYRVFSPRETESRATVQYQMYAHRVSVEAASMRDIGATMIVPAAIAYQKQVAESIAAVAAVEPRADTRSQRELLAKLSEGIGKLRTALSELEHARHAAEETKGGPAEAAHAFREKVIPAMTTLREIADGLEGQVDDALWPLPKYREILFLH